MTSVYKVMTVEKVHSAVSMHHCRSFDVFSPAITASELFDLLESDSFHGSRYESWK